MKITITDMQSETSPIICNVSSKSPKKDRKYKYYQTSGPRNELYGTL